MINDNFTQSYLNLLIKQYYYKPKANAEITLLLRQFSKIYDFLNTFIDHFDIDSAKGKQLDIIGKIVGVSRFVPEVVAKSYFGFYEQIYAKGFSDKVGSSDSAPFFDKFSPQYSDLQLDDNRYRFFIKAKIAVNNASAYLSSDDRTSIQDVIQFLFDGEAYVIDNQNMSLTLYLSPKVSLENIHIINQLNLLPKPQGVRYHFVRSPSKHAFGYSNNPNAIGFSHKQNPISGYFAEKIAL